VYEVEISFTCPERFTKKGVIGEKFTATAGLRRGSSIATKRKAIREDYYQDLGGMGRSLCFCIVQKGTLDGERRGIDHQKGLPRKRDRRATAPHSIWRDSGKGELTRIRGSCAHRLFRRKGGCPPFTQTEEGSFAKREEFFKKQEKIQGRGKVSRRRGIGGRGKGPRSPWHIVSP